MQRIHISGGESQSFSAALARGERHAYNDLLASLPSHYYRPIGVPANDNGRRLVHVGADVMTQPDGSSANVEILPIAPAAGYSVAAAASQAFDLKPTRPFQPTALIIDDDIAKNLTMANLAIGGQPVFCGSGVAVGRGFSHASFINVLSSYWADNATPITFELTNIHASAAQVIRGHFVGNSVRKVQ